MGKEILPNVMGPIVVEATVRLGYAIFAVAGLTFLGFGVQPPSPDWVAPDRGQLHLAQCRARTGGRALPCARDRDADHRRQPDRGRVAAGGRPVSTAEGDHRARHVARSSSRSSTSSIEVRGKGPPGAPRRDAEREAGRGLRSRRRVGLRQVDGGPRDVNYLPRNGRVRSGGPPHRRPGRALAVGAQLRKLRSGAVSMVYQNPGSALNPSIRVGKQVAEVFRIRGEKGDTATRSRRLRARAGADRRPGLGDGAVPTPALRWHAAARGDRDGARNEPVAPDPRRADHRAGCDRRGGGPRPRGRPAGGAPHLGVVHQPQPRDHQQDVRSRRRAVRRSAGRGGRTETVLRDPRHPYTVGLLRCVPRGGVREDHGRLDTIPGFMPNVGEELPGCVFAGRCTLAEAICHTEEPPPHLIGGTHMSRCHFHERAQTLPREEAAELELPEERPWCRPAASLRRSGKVFKQQGHDVHALVGVSAAIWPGETLGLVGESGSGKTTLARSLLGLVQPTSGAVVLDGRELGGPWRSGRATTCDRCRSSSRIRTRRSTGATRCAGSSVAR